MVIHRKLSVVGVLILSGCASCPPHVAIGLPDRPHLEPLEAELQREIPPHALQIISENDIKLKEYALKLESRIRIHNESLED